MTILLGIDIFAAIMSKGRTILEKEQFRFTIDRLCHQLIEVYGDFEDTCLIGVQHRGVLFANRIHQRLATILKDSKIEYGKLDITFYRDDFRTRDKPLVANATELDFLVEGKRVILVDDVLYTGRTIVAALTALQHYGRPQKVELLTLVDRRFNRHLPIQADYTGLTVDALDEAYVKVEWETIDGKDRILLFSNKV
ncbi:MAG: bifunctional pyr operon transcriptional regulator/uracil phosphoribosyltransferase PyrR [Saprospiraceae bacterium]